MTDYCADASEELGEPIIGTSANVRVWLAIEWSEAWAAKAVETAAFPATVRRALDGWGAEIDALRPQLIRRPGREVSSPSVLVGVCAPSKSRVVEIALPSIDALADLDLPAIVAGAPVGRVVEKPVMLVCTHGKRDRCCAKRGTPVYEGVAEHDDVEVWQTSHLGGHRFAATMVCLPHGVCYGRVRPDEVDALLDAVRRDEVFRLDRYRGRSCYDAPAQAAEAFAREHTGVMGVEDVVVAGVTTTGDDQHRATVTVQQNQITLELRRTMSAVMAPPSCNKAPKHFGGYALDWIGSPADR